MSANSERKEIINNNEESEKMIDRNENVTVSDEAKSKKEKYHTDKAHSRLSEISENIIKTTFLVSQSLILIMDQGSSIQNGDSHQPSSPTLNGDSHQSSFPMQNGDSHQFSSSTQNRDSHQSSSLTNLTETEY
ncbi:23156_t:CDS:2, partial [Gigaspora margarita]